MNLHLKNTLLYLIYLLPTLLIGQQSISGKILDASNGEPLIGASILIKDSTTGTVTDFDGLFTINAPQQSKVLIVSYTGYASQEIKLKGYSGEKMIIRLDPGSVITSPGCGVYIPPTANDIQNSKLLTIDDLSGGYSNDLYGLARFRASSTDVFRTGGSPNELHSAVLRGPVSLYGNNRPLLSLNGFYGVDERLIDPLDVQSIRILSGGAGSSSGGYQGGAGMVELTPTKPLEWKNSLRYRGQFAITEVAAFPRVGGREEFIANRVLTGNSDQLPLIDFREDRNWTEDVTETTSSQAHHLAFTHNHRSFRAEAVLNYRNSRGVVVNEDGFEQFNMRLNLNQQFFDRRLNLNLQLIGTERSSRLVDPEVLKNAQLFNPTAPTLADPDNPNLNPDIINISNDRFGGYLQSIFNSEAVYNPIAQLEQTETNEQESLRLLQFVSRLRIVRKLFLEASYHQASGNTRTDQFENTTSLTQRTNLQANRRGYAAQSTEVSKREQYRFGLDYRFGNSPFHLRVKTGFLIQSDNLQGFFIGGRGLPSDAFGPNNLAILQANALGEIEVRGSSSKTRANGWFTNLLSEYRGLRVVSHFRYDKASFLPAGVDRKLFYGVAVSQRLNRLFGRSRFNSELRLRAELGRAGNNPFENLAGGNTFLFQSSSPNFSGQPIVLGLPVPSIETVSSKEIGLTYERSNKLNIALSFYDRLTSDLIIVIPGSQEFTPVYYNSEDISLRNRGVEFSTAYRWKRSDFSWSAAFNLTYNQSRYESKQDDFLIPVSGRDGNTNVDFITPDGRLGELLTFTIGEERLLDANQDGSIGNEDRALSGNALPNLFAGLSNRLGWKGLGLSFTIGGVFGHDVYEYGEQALTQSTGLGSRNVIPGAFPRQLLRIDEAVDYYVRNASYLTLDNLEIGFTINAKAESRLEALRLYLHGRRLLTITQYAGQNPTQRYAISGESPTFGAVRSTDYLPTGVYGFGVDVTFR